MKRIHLVLIVILACVIAAQFVQNRHLENALIDALKAAYPQTRSMTASQIPSPTITPEAQPISSPFPLPIRKKAVHSPYAQDTQEGEPTATPAPLLVFTDLCQKGTFTFSDDFRSASSLEHYVDLDLEKPLNDHDPLKWEVKNGELICTPTGVELGRARIFLKDLYLGSGTDYIVEADAMIESHQQYADFGILFRGSEGSYFTFLWNGNPENRPPRWQVAKFLHDPNHFSWPAAGNPYPAYIPGKWVHFKAVCFQDHFQCFIDLLDGQGEKMVYDLHDGSLTSGTVGFQADFIEPSNKVHFRNLKVTVCRP